MIPAEQPPFGHFKPSPVEQRLIALGGGLSRTRTGRRVASVLRSIMSRIRRDPLDLEVLGQRMRLYAGNNACEKRLIITPQFFDPEEFAYLGPRVTPGFVFLDIGSNVGTYSIFVALRGGPNARVIAIDPNAIVLERLRFNLIANGIETVTTLNTALGDTTGFAEFAIDAQNMGGSSLRLDPGSGETKTRVQVPVRPLFDVVKDAGLARIDAIKIDVEGFEDRILVPYFSSAPEALWPRLVIIEKSAEAWETNCIDLLTDNGYKIALESSGNAVLERAAS